MILISIPNGVCFNRNRINTIKIDPACFRRNFNNSQRWTVWTLTNIRMKSGDHIQINLSTTYSHQRRPVPALVTYLRRPIANLEQCNVALFFLFTNTQMILYYALYLGKNTKV